MQEDTWMQHLVAFNAYTQCNRTANQTLRQNATLHQTLHCNKSTTHCTVAVTAEAKKNFFTSFLHLLVQNCFRIFPHCPLLRAITAKDSASWSHCGTEDLSLAAPFTQAGLNRLPYMTEEEISSSWNERGSRAVCALLRSTGGCCLLALLVPFHLTCFLVPHRCRMTATFLISDPAAYSASCDLCRY